MADFSDRFFHMIEGIPPDKWILHTFLLEEVGILSSLEQSRKAIYAPKSIILICRTFVSLTLQLYSFCAKYAFDAILRQKILILTVDPLVIVDIALFELGLYLREGQLDVACQFDQPVLDELCLWFGCNEGMFIGKVPSLLSS